MSLKRVLMLIKGLGRGGAEQLIASSLPFFERSEFQYQAAYLLPWKTALVKTLERHDFEVTCLDSSSGLRWVSRLRELVRSQNIDLVHVHSPVAAIAARTALPKTVRIVYTEHSVWPRYHRATYQGNLITYPRNDHVFAVSENVRSSVRYPPFLRWMRMPIVETLYHGIDPSSVQEWSRRNGVRAELGIPEDAPVIGTVGNFRVPKGHKYLVSAAKIVKEHFPELRMVFVGLGHENELRKMVEELDLVDTVVFAGFREDAPRICGAFDVFALASIHEGLSIALIEALALGIPAVVTNVGGLPEIVTHKKEGLLVPPRDERALAAALVQVLGDDALRARFSHEARKRAQAFDISKAVKRQEAVYQELLS